MNDATLAEASRALMQHRTPQIEDRLVPLLLADIEGAKVTGISRRTWHNLRHDPVHPLPDPVLIGPRAVRWRRAEVEEWIAALPAHESRSEPAQLLAGKAKKRAPARD